MLNEKFLSRLTSIKPQLHESQILQHFVLLYEDSNSTQNILESFETTYNLNIMKCFDQPIWNIVNFPMHISNLQLSFGGLQFACTLENIKINQVETKTGIVFKYNLEFSKIPNDKIDLILTEFLKRKETNSEGKDVLMTYETSISKN